MKNSPKRRLSQEHLKAYQALLKHPTNLFQVLERARQE